MMIYLIEVKAFDQAVTHLSLAGNTKKKLY